MPLIVEICHPRRGILRNISIYQPITHPSPFDQTINQLTQRLTSESEDVGGLLLLLHRSLKASDCPRQIVRLTGHTRRSLRATVPQARPPMTRAARGLRAMEALGARFSVFAKSASSASNEAAERDGMRRRRNAEPRRGPRRGLYTIPHRHKRFNRRYG